MKKIIAPCFVLFYIGLSLPSLNAQWIKTTSPYSGSQVVALTLSGNSILAGTPGHGVYRSTDAGASWKSMSSGLTSSIAQCFTVSGTNIYVGTYGGVFRSTNGGTNWVPCYGPSNDITDLAFVGTNLFAASRASGVFISTDDGKNWNSANSGLTNLIFTSLAVAGATIYAGGDAGVFRSTDIGRTWLVLNDNLKGAFGVLGVAGISVFAGTWPDGIFVISNNEVSWTFKNSAMDNSQFTSIVAAGNYIFAATWEKGIFLSTDHGSSWGSINGNLASQRINCLAVSSTDIYASVGGEIWRRPLSGIISTSQIMNPNPSDFSVLQNYPNPFNPKTIIHYSLPKTTRISLKIFNELGQVVSTLADEEKSAGNYRVAWDGSTVSGGIYFYRFQAGEFVETKKMVLLK